jgi:small subunit ribosomal protein S4
VTHGHFVVNGVKTNIPSFQVSRHDIIDVRGKSLEMTPFIVSRETHDSDTVPGWMDVSADHGRILIHQTPIREQITVPIQEQLIVEYYSKI